MKNQKSKKILIISSMGNMNLNPQDTGHLKIKILKSEINHCENLRFINYVYR